MNMKTFALRCIASFVFVPVIACGSNSNDSNGSGGSTANAGAPSTGGANNAGQSSTGGANNAGQSSTSGGSGSGTAGSTSATGGSAGTAAPASSSKADIAAFIDSGAYKQAPWVSDVSSPRAATFSASQHGDGVRVFENPTLVTAMKTGHDGKDTNPAPDVGSMAVKEMYDSGGQLVGVAAALRSSETSSWGGWTYYCYAPNSRCASGDYAKTAPLYGNGAVAPGQGCAICHNATIFTSPP